MILQVNKLQLFTIIDLKSEQLKKPIIKENRYGCLAVAQYTRFYVFKGLLGTRHDRVSR